MAKWSNFSVYKVRSSNTGAWTISSTNNRTYADRTGHNHVQLKIKRTEQTFIFVEQANRPS